MLPVDTARSHMLYWNAGMYFGMPEARKTGGGNRMATESRVQPAGSTEKDDRDGMEIDLVELLYRLLEKARYIILAALLGLGTSACEIPAMYGTPHADWSVKGKVVDEEYKPVAGLQVVMGNRFENTPDVIYDENYRPLDTLYTAADGTYSVKRTDFPIDRLEIRVQDVDGPAGGGEFQDAGLIIRDIEYKDGKGWDAGHAEIEVPDIIVRKKL